MKSYINLEGWKVLKLPMMKGLLASANLSKVIIKQVEEMSS